MYKMVIIGNLGSKPELNNTPDGRCLANFNVATTRKVKGVEDTVWTRVTVWDQTALNCQKYLDKGSKVCVWGRPSPHAWIDKAGGAKGSIEINADEVEFLSAGRQQMTETDEPAPFEE